MSDSPIPPSEDEREVTGIHDIPRELRPWARSQSRKVRELQDHFKDHHSDPNKRGMVAQMSHDVSSVKWLITKALPLFLLVLIPAVGALIWTINAAAPKPTPPPSAQDIAREVLKQQGK